MSHTSIFTTNNTNPSTPSHLFTQNLFISKKEYASYWKRIESSSVKMQKSKNKKHAQSADCFICAFEYAVIWGWFAGLTLIIGRCPHSFQKSTRPKFRPERKLCVLPFFLYLPMILYLKYNVDLLLSEKDVEKLPQFAINIMFSLLSLLFLFTGFTKHEALANELNNCSKMVEKKGYYGINYFFTSKDIFYIRLESYLFLLLFIVVPPCVICTYSFADNNYSIYKSYVKSTGLMLGLLSLGVAGLQTHGISIIFRILYKKCFEKIVALLNKKLQNKDRNKTNKLFVKPELGLEIRLKRLREFYIENTKVFMSLINNINFIMTFTWLEGVLILIFRFFHIFTARENWHKVDFLIIARDSTIIIAVVLCGVIAQRVANLVSVFLIFFVIKIPFI